MTSRSFVAASNSLMLIRTRDRALMASHNPRRRKALRAVRAARTTTENPFWGVPALSKIRAFSTITETRWEMSDFSSWSLVANLSKVANASE